MIFSFVIINYNYKNITKDCINSIFDNCNNNFEIIIVDNASVDDSTKFLYTTFKNKIKIIKNNSNLGFAKACNIGASFASGKYLFFLNNDTIIEEDILNSIEEAFKDDKIGAVSPELFTIDGKQQAHAFGKFPSLSNLFFKRREGGNKEDMDWLSGAALVVKQDIFEELGGFDENFFMYFEDIDLCKRIKDRGYELKIINDAHLMHLGGKSLKIDKQRKNIYYKSQDYFYKKYYGFPVVLMIRFFRFFYRIFLNK